MRETQQERLQRMLAFERTIWDADLQPGGMDEVGRGPLAGPVVVACVVIEPEKAPLGVNDSKKLSEPKREELYEILKTRALRYSVQEASPEMIERLNIRGATRDAMRRAAMEVKPDYLLVDAERDLDVPMPQSGVIKGDATHYCIAAASILAKVTRDRMMREYDRLYPEYGFSRNKGYGTKEHIEALCKYGPCPIHRPSFVQTVLDKHL